MEHKCKKTDLKTVEKCELNVEQIKKALECCVKVGGYRDAEICNDCPLSEKRCAILLPENALALINSQEQRIVAQDMTISELRQRSEKAEHDAKRYAQGIKELTEEVKSLKQAMEHEHASFMETFGEYGEKCERLTVELDAMRGAANSYKMHNEKLTEENKRLEKELAKSYEALDEQMNFYCSFTQSKVSNCPIDDEVAKAKADTVRKMYSEIKTRFAMLFGTYTDKDMTPITEVFWFLDQIEKEMLEGKEICKSTNQKK